MFTPLSRSRSKKSLARRKNLSRRRLLVEALESRKLMAAMIFDSVQTFGIGESSTSIEGGIVVDSDGNSYMTGYFQGTVDFDPGVEHPDNSDILTSVGPGRDLYIAKYDAQDGLLWAKRFGSDTTTAGQMSEERVFHIKLDPQNNVYVTGRFRDTLQIDSFNLVSAGAHDAYLVKIESDGTTAWASRWGTSGYDETGFELAFGPAGELYVGASNQDLSNTLPSSKELRRVNQATGELVWEKSWAISAGSMNLDVDSEGNIVLVNTFRDAFDADPGPGQTILDHGFANNATLSASVIQLDSSGNFRWARTFNLYENTTSLNSSSFALPGQMAIDLNDNIVIVGKHTGRVDYDPSDAGSAELSLTASAFVVKLSNAGDFVWVRGVDGPSYRSHEFTDLLIDSANNIVTIAHLSGGGTTLDYAPGSETAFVTFLNTDPSDSSKREGILWSLTEAGEFRSVTHLGAVGASIEPQGLVIDGSNRWQVVGSFVGTVDFDPNAGVSQMTSATRSGFSLRLDPTPGVTVSQTKGLVTTEAGGTTHFSVSLDAAPTDDVTIPVGSSDLTEGTVSVSSLTFTPSNWNVPQTVWIQGVDDATYDLDVAYTVVLGATISADARYNALDVADVSVTNIDNDVSSTKFFVVNDGSPDRTYEYDASGSGVGNYTLNSGNTAPRGAASTVAGDTLWVVDTNKNVYVYNAIGGLLGSWSAGGLNSRADVQGITTNGTDIWLVDARQDAVYKYTGAASRLSGSQNAASNFPLNNSNTSPTDLVTDGNSIWVVNDSSTDKVFKYGMTGSLLGSWTINSGGGKPTGITLDPNPSQTSNSLWIVDTATDRVYEYANSRGRISGSQAASVTFALAAGNTNPQGIADPPPPATSRPLSAMVPISPPWNVLDSVYGAANDSRATDSRGTDAWQTPISKSSDVRRTTETPSVSVETTIRRSASMAIKQSGTKGSQESVHVADQALRGLELRTSIDGFFASVAMTDNGDDAFDYGY